MGVESKFYATTINHGMRATHGHYTDSTTDHKKHKRGNCKLQSPSTILPFLHHHHHMQVACKATHFVNAVLASPISEIPNLRLMISENASAYRGM